MGDENDLRKPSMYDDHDDPKRYFIMEFGKDPKTGKTTMSLKGPTGTSKIYTEGGAEVRLYNQSGRYVVEYGISKSSIDKDDLPEAYKPLFGLNNIYGLSGPVVEIQYPSRDDVRASGSGISSIYMSYEEYKKKVGNRERDVKMGLKSAFLYDMPKVFYDALIWYYRTHDVYDNPLYL